MTNKKFAKLSFSAAVALALLLMVTGVSLAASSSDPTSPVGIVPTQETFPGGEPVCGSSLGYRFNSPADGMTVFNDGAGNTITINVTQTADGEVFSWTASAGIVVDKVFAKGATDQNVYDYTGVNPRPSSDGNLHAPVNESGKYAGLSHIDFCYHYELTASKTANAEFTRTYTWDISKTADPTLHEGFTGDSFTSDYVVTVDQTVADSGFAVSGEITVNNPSPFTVSFSVSDSVGGTAATVDCDPDTDGNQTSGTLDPGGSTVCSYSADLGDINPGDGTNTATITSNTAGVDGASASADYAFGDPTNTEGYPTVNVTDSEEGDLGTASGDTTFPYSRTFTCEDEGENPNTATIVETGQEASASVTVNCYELTVTKDADTSFTRTWDWTIEKTGDQISLTLSPGQTFTVNYDVTVNATSADSDHAVSGNISVNNPATIDATINSVSDIVSPDIAASVDCGVTFPYTLTAGDTLNCTYAADLPDDADRTNTVTATLQNYDYDSAGVGSASGTTDFSFTANVDFDGATIAEVDECIDVTDDNGTPDDPSDDTALGTVCADDDLPVTFEFTLDVGPYEVCGTYEFVNVASFVTNDSETTGSDDHTVNVNVPCGVCTLTQGYWKTHSEKGPAPYDDTWAMLANSADTPFFLSGQTWYEVFWTAPAGNPYYNLAHQYMAAYLNILNGASTTAEVDAAIDFAETFFATHSPFVKLTKAERNAVLAAASTLDQYNNGLIGPGHCSE